MAETLETYAYEPIDLYSCYEPTVEPPQSMIDEWSRHWESFFANKEKSFYVIDEDNTQYFYCGNSRIKVTEHFANNGKTYDTLIEDVIHYTANRQIEQTRSA